MTFDEFIESDIMEDIAWDIVDNDHKYNKEDYIITEITDPFKDKSDKFYKITMDFKIRCYKKYLRNKKIDSIIDGD